MSSGGLITQRRFWPFFWVSFLTSFNDNVFKQALVVLVAAKSLSLAGLASETVQLLAPAIIILPFVLASATAGQLSDRQPKAITIRWVKIAELPVMMLGAYGLISENTGVMLATLFLTGLQSTFFGPAKYSFLPEVLADDELVGGNGLIEMGTFLSVLTGTILGGILATIPDVGGYLAGGACLLIALAGILCSYVVPVGKAAAPDLVVKLNPITPNIEILRETTRDRSVFLSVLGLSWFWLFGAAFLALVPPYVKDVLSADPTVITLCVAVFSIGIGFGAVMCERLGQGQLELGLVPFGSFGMSLFALDLAIVGTPALAPGLSWTQFLATGTGIRISIDLMLLAMFGGFFTVPLYTLIQQRSDDRSRSRVIAGNNLINSVFIVASAGLLIGLRSVGVSIPAIFAILAAANLIVGLYIYHLLPEFLLRFVGWMLCRVMYRMRVENRASIPAQGAALLVANHVTYIDFLFIASASRRPVRFVMWYEFLRMPLVGWVFRGAKVIPIAPHKHDPVILQAAYDSIDEALRNGELVCIFPEGGLTWDGGLMPFKPGLEGIVDRNQVQVVPIALKGLWGSFFSRFGGAAMRRPFRRFRSKIELVVGAPVEAPGVTAQGCEDTVAALGSLERSKVSPPQVDASAAPSPGEPPAG